MKIINCETIEFTHKNPMYFHTQGLFDLMLKIVFIYNRCLWDQTQVVLDFLESHYVESDTLHV